MKGDYSEFHNIGEVTAENGFKNGVDYNTANSQSVKQVDHIQTLSEVHSIPIVSSPNSVTRNYRNGSLYTERYFGENGKPYLDIDYSNHGNPSTHKNVPHEHIIEFDTNGKMHRRKETGIQK